MNLPKVSACLSILTLTFLMAVGISANTPASEETISDRQDSLGDSPSPEDIETRDWFADLPSTDRVVSNGKTFLASSSLTFDPPESDNLFSKIYEGHEPKLSFAWNLPTADTESISFRIYRDENFSSTYSR